MKKKYKADIHTHTVASGHAYSTFTENVNYAAETGLEVLGISDHTPEMPGSTSPLHFVNFSVLPKEVKGVKIFMGCELNIMDEEGSIDLPERTIKKLDYAIASLHIPCIKPMTAEKNTEALINTIKNPLVNIIGHPGDPRYPFDIQAVVRCARDNDTILELNNTSLDPNNGRFGGASIILEILDECKKLNFPIILGSDAHYHTYIGNFDNAERLLKEADFPDELILNYNMKEFFNFMQSISDSKKD